MIFIRLNWSKTIPIDDLILHWLLQKPNILDYELAYVERELEPL